MLLGATGYNRRFIRCYASGVSSPYDLLVGHLRWVVENIPIYASTTGLGTVLRQTQNGIDRVVANSKHLKPVAKKHETHL